MLFIIYPIGSIAQDAKNFKLIIGSNEYLFKEGDRSLKRIGDEDNIVKKMLIYYDDGSIDNFYAFALKNSENVHMKRLEKHLNYFEAPVKCGMLILNDGKIIFISVDEDDRVLLFDSNNVELVSTSAEYYYYAALNRSRTSYCNHNHPYHDAYKLKRQGYEKVQIKVDSNSGWVFNLSNGELEEIFFKTAKIRRLYDAGPLIKEDERVGYNIFERKCIVIDTLENKRPLNYSNEVQRNYLLFEGLGRIIVDSIPHHVRVENGIVLLEFKEFYTLNRFEGENIFIREINKITLQRKMNLYGIEKNASDLLVTFHQQSVPHQVSSISYWTIVMEAAEDSRGN